MARGYDEHNKRLDIINRLGKDLSKQARFQCEWCEGKEQLRPYDTAPDQEPDHDTLLFLCLPCRDLAAGVKVEPETLRGHANALWSERDIVKNRLAEILITTGQRWAREAVENAWLDEELKARLLGE